MVPESISEKLFPFRKPRNILANGDSCVTYARFSKFFNTQGLWEQAPYYQNARRIKEAIAWSWGLPFQQLFVGHGVDELLHDLIATAEPSGQLILVFWPSYPFGERIAQMYSGNLVRVSLCDDGSYPKKLPPEVVAAQPGLAIIVNPTNPGGVFISRDKIESYLRQLPTTRFIIDEAYVDFQRDRSLLSMVRDESRVVVVRGFSKGYGLPGLRVGVAVSGNLELITSLHERRLHFFSPFAIEGTIHAVTCPDYFEQTVRLNLKTKDVLAQMLRNVLGMTVIETGANFLLVRLPPDIERQDFKRACMSLGVEFWWFDETPFFEAYFGNPPQHPSLRGTFRVSPVPEEDLPRLVEILERLAYQQRR